MLEFSLPEFIVVCGSVLLLILLLTEVLDWTQVFSWVDIESHVPVFAFGYADPNGPHTWKLSYPEGAGNNQSPINITTRLAVAIQLSDPLRWNGYRVGPLSMTIANDGSTVILCAHWGEIPLPNLSGGPLSNTYNFSSVLFHWGPSNDEGSEHTLDYIRYPMELQMIHVKTGTSSISDAIKSGSKDGIAIVSFFFQITDADNPYLDHIVTNLWRISQAGSKVHVPPFPLEWIVSPFDKNYYAYNGSLTQPPCSEIVTWIIQPEPIAISASQVAEFRKICSVDGPLLLNCRPVQSLNERDVYFYE